jgi:hypothetical protein
VKSKGDIDVLNELFHIGGEYIGEFCWATIDTREHSLIVVYNDEDMVVRELKKFDYEIREPVHDPIFRSNKIKFQNY